MITACGRCSACDVLRRTLQVGRAAAAERLAPARQSARRCRRAASSSTSYAAHAQVEPEVAREPLDLRRELIEQHAADRARARSGRSRSCAATGKSRHARHAARARSAAPSMTTEMLRSDAPCAIARTLTPDAPSALNTLRGDAGRAGHAVADHGEDAAVARSTSTLWICPSRSSRSNASRTTALGALRLRLRAPRSRSSARSCPARSGSTEMPSSRSAPNSRCAVPGTPIMPAPSRLISAMPSMLVMPLTGWCDAGRCADQRAGFLGRERVADPDRNSLAARPGAMVCGWMTLAPKYASSIASLYDSASMTVRVRHAARIGAQHAVDVGPDHDLVARRATRRRSSRR